MGIVNPSYQYRGGDTLFDLNDKTAINRYTAGLIRNAIGFLSNGVIANSSGTLAHTSYTTTTTLNNIASDVAASSFSQTYGLVYRLTVMQVKLDQTATCRAFIGIASATGNSWSSDTPTNDAYGFRYSTNVPDTNWQCVNNGGGTNTISDSGVPVTTAQFLLAVEAFGTSKINFYINRNLVKTNTTNLPRTSVTNYGQAIGICNLQGGVGSAKTVRISFTTDRQHAL